MGGDTAKGWRGRPQSPLLASAEAKSPAKSTNRKKESPIINLSTLLNDFEACIGFPYASPGTNDERGIDCSGLFVRAFRRQGASIYHGSNTIFRKYLARSGRIESAADLRPGMAVFKWKSETPRRFSDDLGDFCHIGLVTSVSPLRIVHASTEGMCVKADSKIGKWRYWGWLKDVVEDTSAAPSEVPVHRPTLRTGSRGEAVRTLQTLLNRAGYELAVDGVFGTMTRCSVKGFQSEQGLTVDGIVGSKTWAALSAWESGNG